MTRFCGPRRLRTYPLLATRLGARFHLPAFHDCPLRNGALSLPTLSQVVEEWIEAGGTS